MAIYLVVYKKDYRRSDGANVVLVGNVADADAAIARAAVVNDDPYLTTAKCDAIVVPNTTVIDSVFECDAPVGLETSTSIPRKLRRGGGAL